VRTLPVHCRRTEHGHLSLRVGAALAGPRAANSAGRSSGLPDRVMMRPMGVCTAAIGCPQTNVVRSAFQFTGMTAVASLRKADITKAEFTVFGYHSYSCSSRPVELWRTDKISSSTTWNNFGSGSGKWLSQLGTKDIAHKDDCNNRRDITWGVKSAAEWMAANDSSWLTLGLKGSSTTDVVTWKRYSNPRLEIWWNRAPLAPKVSDMSTLSKGAPYGCKTSQSTRSVFRYRDDLKVTGVGRDPDAGDQVQVLFKVVDHAAGSVVWNSGWTDLRTKPFEFTRTVPTTAIQDGRVYRWRMLVRDAGGRVTSDSDSPNCYFEADLTSPDTPSVHSAKYPEDKLGGGVGQAGSFTFSAKANDIVRFEYSFDSEAMTQSVSANSGTATVTPPSSLFTAGSHYVKVQAVDNAGRQSKSPATYRFSVRFPSVDAYWHFDEGAGTTAADSSGLGNDLSLGSGASWIEGAISSVFQVEGADDWALDLDGTSSASATSAGPVVHMDQSQGAGEAFHGFAVSAFVRADSSGSANQVAVSQDAQATSSFKLGRLTMDRCPEGANGTPLSSCWGFWMANEDAKGGVAYSRAVSDRPINPGEWVHLTGVYDAEEGLLDLFVCPVGVPGQAPPDDGSNPVRADTTSYIGSTWAGGGPVQVGRGMYQGNHNDFWDGGIDDVRLYTNQIIDIPRIRELCWGDKA
jgi:hypothetical protein